MPVRSPLEFASHTPSPRPLGALFVICRLAMAAVKGQPAQVALENDIKEFQKLQVGPSFFNPLFEKYIRNTHRKPQQ